VTLRFELRRVFMGPSPTVTKVVGVMRFRAASAVEKLPTSASPRRRQPQPEASRVRPGAGGCSGFQYGFTFDDCQRSFHAHEEQRVLLIDAMSLRYLSGSRNRYKADRTARSSSFTANACSRPAGQRLLGLKSRRAGLILFWWHYCTAAVRPHSACRRVLLAER
jgi:Fe-S cluster assembly iron-binding protein IscA